MIRALRRAGLAAVLALAAIGTVASWSPSLAQGQQIGPETNLPLPRFVSLGSSEVNVRVGPGANYPIDWTYVRRSLPVEITQEFGNWRKIRDSEGNEGWVLSSLLSGERYALVLPGTDEAPMEVHASPDANARVVALLQAGVIASVDRCQDGWCRLVDGRFNGWVVQDRLWGVYPGEEFN